MILFNHFIFLTISKLHSVFLIFIIHAHAIFVSLGLSHSLLVLNDTIDIIFKFDVLTLLQAHNMLGRQVVNHLQVLLVINRCMLEIHLTCILIVIAVWVIFTPHNKLPWLFKKTFILLSHFDIQWITLMEQVLFLTRRQLLNYFE